LFNIKLEQAMETKSRRNSVKVRCSNRYWWSLQTSMYWRF